VYTYMHVCLYVYIHMHIHIITHMHTTCWYGSSVRNLRSHLATFASMYSDTHTRTRRARAHTHTRQLVDAQDTCIMLACQKHTHTHIHTHPPTHSHPHTHTHTTAGGCQGCIQPPGVAAQPETRAFIAPSFAGGLHARVRTHDYC
jgi:hypothetical protein